MSLIRGIRGATTVTENNELEIIENTRQLVLEMIEKNNVQAEDVSSVLVTVTDDLTATFPAKPIRQLPGWTYVPVMCMQEIKVPHGLPRCIRIMMTINTSIAQEDIHHIYHNDARKLRPDLLK
ncbi:chorismate mutase [Amphibacillus xylanus]|uniref:chorismate mutase n=1 Tax=Amphibacillus xylanus (strain ATCC 51415 / DSM 6626 / JCM 7361 / LMG 17667 / NBRC 15112 / Ep01) TaxID=698758 RepID=K0J2K9_AMPXN|nr:chorismate mutase [Amphibacillus xylanus NBRC 15112]